MQPSVPQEANHNNSNNNASHSGGNRTPSRQASISTMATIHLLSLTTYSRWTPPCNNRNNSRLTRRPRNNHNKDNTCNKAIRPMYNLICITNNRCIITCTTLRTHRLRWCNTILLRHNNNNNNNNNTLNRRLLLARSPASLSRTVRARLSCLSRRRPPWRPLRVPPIPRDNPSIALLERPPTFSRSIRLPCI